jgi:hypothetical protein
MGRQVEMSWLTLLADGIAILSLHGANRRNEMGQRSRRTRSVNYRLERVEESELLVPDASGGSGLGQHLHGMRKENVGVRSVIRFQRQDTYCRLIQPRRN